MVTETLCSVQVRDPSAEYPHWTEYTRPNDVDFSIGWAQDLANSHPDMDWRVAEHPSSAFQPVWLKLATR